MLKYLRISLTALSLTACVLLVALWVRSYWRADVVIGRLPGTGSFQAISCYGKLAVIVGPQKATWNYYSNPSYDFAWRIDQYKRIGLFAVLPRVYNRHEITVSYVVISLLFTAAAALPWTGCRLSLRSLLIATALIAVALGMVVAAR